MLMWLQDTLLVDSTWSIRSTHRKFRFKEKCLSKLCTCAHDRLTRQVVVEARSRKQRNPHVHRFLKRAASCGGRGLLRIASLHKFERAGTQPEPEVRVQMSKDIDQIKVETFDLGEQSGLPDEFLFRMFAAGYDNPLRIVKWNNSLMSNMVVADRFTQFINHIHPASAAQAADMEYYHTLLNSRMEEDAKHIATHVNAGSIEFAALNTSGLGTDEARHSYTANHVYEIMYFQVVGLIMDPSLRYPNKIVASMAKLFMRNEICTEKVDFEKDVNVQDKQTSEKGSQSFGGLELVIKDKDAGADVRLFGTCNRVLRRWAKMLEACGCFEDSVRTQGKLCKRNGKVYFLTETAILCVFVASESYQERQGSSVKGWIQSMNRLQAEFISKLVTDRDTCAGDLLKQACHEDGVWQVIAREEKERRGVGGKYKPQSFEQRTDLCPDFMAGIRPCRNLLNNGSCSLYHPKMGKGAGKGAGRQPQMGSYFQQQRNGYQQQYQQSYYPQQYQQQYPQQYMPYPPYMPPAPYFAGQAGQPGGPRPPPPNPYAQQQPKPQFPAIKGP